MSMPALSHKDMSYQGNLAAGFTLLLQKLNRSKYLIEY